MKHKHKRKNKERSNPGLLSGVFAAYLVLILHVLLIMGIGLLVVFFSGIVNYFLWIFIGGMIAIAASAYLVYRRLRSRGRGLREALKTPLLAGRSVEIEFLGGLASLKVGDSRKDACLLDSDAAHDVPRLEDPATMQVKELSELARLFESGLISLEEFETFKARLLK